MTLTHTTSANTEWTVVFSDDLEIKKVWCGQNNVTRRVLNTRVEDLLHAAFSDREEYRDAALRMEAVG